MDLSTTRELAIHSERLKPSGGYHGPIDHLFSRHMPVLRARIPDGVEPPCDRKCSCHEAAASTLVNLRTPPGDVGRQRDRAPSNPGIRGNAAYLGKQARTNSLLRTLGSGAVARHSRARATAGYLTALDHALDLVISADSSCAARAPVPRSAQPNSTSLCCAGRPVVAVPIQDSVVAIP